MEMSVVSGKSAQVSVQAETYKGLESAIINPESLKRNMTEGSLSPFLELPLHMEGMHSILREKFARLEYELASMKTEKRLLEQNKEASVARYELLLSRKNEELARLQSNFDFVYKQRKELQLKVKNQADVLGKSSGDSDKQVKSLAAENQKLLVKVDKYERALQKATGQREHLCSDLNRELAVSDQYRERIQTLEAENKELVDLNRTLLQKSALLTTLIESGYARKNEELSLRVLSLQKTNNELQSKFDLNLQQKTSIEILKLKNATLAQKLKSLELVKIHASQLELEKNALQAKFDEYFGIISATVEHDGVDSRDKIVTNFVQSFKTLQNKNLVLVDKLNQSLTQLSDLQQTYQNLREKTDSEYLPRIGALEVEVSAQKDLVQELTKVKLLNGKEIEFLRKSLKDMDDLTSRQKASSSSPSLTPENTEKIAMNQYLTNLEKLVDEYKHEIEQLRKDSNKENVKHCMPTKRPRLIEEDDDKIRTVHSLRTENLELLSQVKSLTDECDNLKRKLQLHKSEMSSLQILELRSNPFRADQLIKQETLDLLRKENCDLVGKYMQSESIDSIPKSLFVRQEHDKEVLQTKIDNLVKQISRLKSIYAEKSRDIVTTISRFFGYKIEFIPSPVNPNDLCSKIKLVSKHASQSDAESNKPYLIIDVHTRTLKANGNLDFKNMCEELVDQWVSEKHLIPCFLSALNLRLYENSNT